MVGATLGSYRIVSEIGSGGMGVVYLAEHTLIGRKAAVKLLRSDMPQEYVERFFNEAKAAATLHHPGLVDVFDFGQNKDGSAFIVMEFLQGESLAQRLEREPRLPIATALAITRSVANALYVAHEQGIIHRDLKPANIFLIADADAPAGVRTKVLDFGIAKLARDRDVRSVKTQSGAVIGTPRYMSPEQCKNARSVDGRADIYSLGCILYEMLLGVAPFDYDSWAELVGAHIYEVPPRPSEIDPKLPAIVETLLDKMLEKAPENRFASMQDLAQSLEVLLAEHGVASRSTPTGVIRVTPAGGVKKVSAERDATLAADSGEVKGPGSKEIKKREAEPTLPTPTDLKKKPSADRWKSAIVDAKLPTTVEVPEPAPVSKPADTAPPPSRDFSEVTQAVRKRPVPWLAIGVAGAGVAALAIAAFVVFGRHDRQPAGDDKTYIVVDDRHDEGSAAAHKVDPPVTVDAAVAIVEPPRADAGAARTPPKPPTETDVAALTRTFSSQSPAITACFAKNGNPTEQVSVRIQIDAKGNVQAAEVLPGSVGSSPLGACLVAIAKQTHFGPQPKPAAFRVPLHIDAR